MCIAERANLIQSGQPIDGGEREIAPERVAMPCDARSSPFVVIGSPGARMKALRADDTNSHCVERQRFLHEGTAQSGVQELHADPDGNGLKQLLIVPSSTL